jgi:type II secretory ATPase GspE/PulE/Tfp pilus assembly ATPase PilB-like protein/CRP-like cAMP-binding protein
MANERVGSAPNVAPPNDRGQTGAVPITIDPEVLRQFVSATPLFSACDAAAVAKITPHLKAMEFPAGATMIRAGAPAEWMGLLFRGRASVKSINAATGEAKLMEMLRPGDYFGEIGPLCGVAQPHAVVADEASQVLRLSSDSMTLLGERLPSFSNALAKRLGMRVLQLGMMAARSAPPRPESAAAAVPTPPSPPTAGDVIPFVEASEYDLTPKVVAMLPEQLILRDRMLPLSLKGNTLTIGMVEPKNPTARADLQRVLHKMDIQVVAISQDDYDQSLTLLKLGKKHEGDRARPGSSAISADSLSFDVADSERESENAPRVIGEEVVRCVSRIIAEALEREASDVHIEPEAGGVKVRFRVHGVLHDSPEYLPSSFARGIVARLKVLAGLNIAERRQPQDGRIGLTAGRRDVDLRVSTLPASRGEKVVLRVLESSGIMRPLDHTFLEPSVLAAMRNALGRTAGAIIVAGTTGSGKSTSLYSMLADRRKRRPDTNVLMVEDPIEYRMAGATQVQINPAIGLGFPQVLRAMLRQDPDVIVLGETRDADTAELALEAAMTGHLVLTSLHASDVTSTIQRLESFGCQRPLLAQSLSLVVVQRLVRRLCTQCAELDLPPEALADSLVARKLVPSRRRAKAPRAVGCDACGHSGYDGRVAAVEAMTITDELRDALMVGQTLTEVENIATASRVYFPFHLCASYLMGRSIISAADALTAVAG